MFEELKARYKNRRWKMYLFYNGILIKRIRVRNIDDIDSIYLRVIGHKELFHNENVGIVVRPSRLLKTDEVKRKTYWGVVLEMGVEIND